MHVVFRADASLDIGTGHVMRCLTLADALRERGVQCRFISRAHAGHLAALIEQRGHEVILLPLQSSSPHFADAVQPAHAAWLGAGVTQDMDALECLSAINACIGSGVAVDWLVVDHYALDHRWERLLRAACQRVMAIDDLADRFHDCDLLLDQNLGRAAQDYAAVLLNASCTVLIGPRYALLRPEFITLRPYSLARRNSVDFRRLLISMGGVDKDNVTSSVLDALRNHPLPTGCEIEVVMGPHAPHLVEVKEIAASMPWSTEVSVNVVDMAKRLSECDLTIGAAGSTSWERCSLGIPSLLVCVADNQRMVIEALESAGAAAQLDSAVLTQSNNVLFHVRLSRLINNLREYAAAAAHITDGCGAERVCAELLSHS